MIRVNHLRKVYSVFRRPPGLKAAFQSLFHRRYEDVVAVDDLSFHIAPGERVGFLGPNGAGKTTTLKMLAGLLHPTAGQVTVDGYEPFVRDERFLKAIMLVLGQKQQLLWDLPPSETFELNRAIYEVPWDQYRETLGTLTELLNLGPLLGKPTRQLSLGERMKCELAASLIHRPKVLFLDEPTIGLDVGMQVTIRKFIREYNEQTGATLMLTSHYMEDVEALCPRVIVINHGRLAYDGSLKDLVRTMHPEKRIVLRFHEANIPIGDHMVGYPVVSREGGQVVLQVPEAAVKDVLAQVLSQVAVRDLTVEDPPLEGVIEEVFKRGAPEVKS